MKLASFVREDMVLADLAATHKDAVIDELASFVAARTPGVDAATVGRVLKEREKLASTAVGEGVAIPHGKVAGLEEIVGCVARSKQGVDFEALDGRPTHLFVVLIVPENSTGAHLKALARVSRLFKEPRVRARLLEAADARAMYAALMEEDAQA